MKEKTKKVVSKIPLHAQRKTSSLQRCLSLFRGTHLAHIALLSLMLFSVVSSTIILPSPVHAIAASPTNETECKAAGGSWQYISGGGNNPFSCQISMVKLMSPQEEAASYSYYVALQDCVSNRMYGDIAASADNDGNVSPSSWYNNGNADYTIYPYSKASCADLTVKALDLWGWKSDYKSFFTSIGYTLTDKLVWHGPGDASNGGDRWNSFSAAIRSKVYSNSFTSGLPPRTNAAIYVQSIDSFTSERCKAKDLGIYGSISNTTYRSWIDQKKVINSADSTVKGIITDASGDIQFIKVTVVNSDGKTEEHGYVYETHDGCSALPSIITSSAPGWQAWIEQHPNRTDAIPPSTNSTTPGGDSAEKKQSCNVEGIGWIVCPVMRFMSQIVDQAYGAISTLLTTPAIDTSTSDTNPMYKAWSTMRSFANIIFVIGFLVIIFSQITSVGLNNYGIKKMLPRLIIAAILVNISYWLCAIAVDISNILGVSLKSLMDTTSSSLYVDGGAVSSGGGGGWDVLTIGVLGTAGAVALLYLELSVLFPMLIAALLAIVTVVLVLTLRQALIIILIVISPLAFVAYLLPNTEKWFSKWRELFQVLLLMFPIIAIIFGGSALASTIISNVAHSTKDPNIILEIMAAGITIIPLFIVPVVMKTAGGLLNRFGGIINNPNKGPFDRMRKGAERIRNNSAYVRGKNARQQLKQGRKNREFADQYELGRKIANREEPLRTAGMSALEVSKRAAAVRAYTASRGPTSALDAAARFTAGAGMNSSIPIAQYLGAKAAQAHSLTGAEGRAADLSELSEHYKSEVEKATEAALKDAVRSLGKEIATVRASGGDTDAFLKTRATDANQTSTARDAALHTAASLGRDGVIRDLDAGGLVPKESIQEAITANAGSLINKAPDLVKPKSVAFNSVNGGELSKFSAGTAAEYVKHLNDLKTSGSADYANALASFKSAIVDIQNSSDLQGAFKSDVGNALLKASAGTALSTDIGAERSGLTANAGKIR